MEVQSFFHISIQGLCFNILASMQTTLYFIEMVAISKVLTAQCQSAMNEGYDSINHKDQKQLINYFLNAWSITTIVINYSTIIYVVLIFSPNETQHTKNFQLITKQVRINSCLWKHIKNYNQFGKCNSAQNDELWETKIILIIQWEPINTWLWTIHVIQF